METDANSLIINPPKGINPINNDRTKTQTEMMRFAGISKMADAIEEIIADVNMLKEARTISKIMGITRITRIRIMAIKISTRIIAQEIIRIKEEIKIRILKMVSAINTKMGHANISLADLSMFIEITIKTLKEIIKTAKTPFKEIIKTHKTTFRETTKIILRIKNLAHFLHEDIATKDKIATFRMKRQNNRHHNKINKINKRGFAGILRIRDSVNLVMGVDFLMVNNQEEVET